MSDGGIEAGIQFIRYKIDNIDFKVTKTLGVLNSSDHSNAKCNFQFSVSNPAKYKTDEDILYVVGLATIFKLMRKDEPDGVMAEGSFSISGLFKGIGNIPKELEEKLVIHQAPAILFPFLRSAVSSVLLNAGFSQIQMPLINVNRMTQDMKLQIVEQ